MDSLKQRFAALCCALAVACAVPSVARTQGEHRFVYDTRADLFGYYLPETPPRVGRYRLHDLAVGGREDFQAFFHGKRSDSYAPVMFEFDDVTSPRRTNALGQPYYVRAPRVLPLAFRVEGNNIFFHGSDRRVGDVVFQGRFAPYMFTTAGHPRRRAVQGGPALTGDLTINGTTYKQVSFTWFGGD